VSAALQLAVELTAVAKAVLLAEFLPRWG